MARRKNGEGTIVQRKDGRWQASLRMNGTRRTVYGKTEREARKKLRELQRQSGTTRKPPSPGGRTLSDLIEAWLASAALRPTTMADYRRLYSYISPTLGDTELTNISPDAIQRLYTRFSPSVAQHIHRVLHRAFTVAVLWRWLPDNPCDRVLKPVYKTARKILWTRAELDTFLQGTADHWLNPLFVLLISTGMRPGEALALQWNNVSADGMAVTVTGTLHRFEGEYIVSEPKTTSSERTVLLPPVGIAALERQKAQQATSNTGEDTEFVFTGELGQPIHKSTVSHAMRRLCKQLGLPAVTPHGLRHLHASLLLDEGVPVTAVSARLGHANPNITMQTYAHALPGQDSRAAQAIGKVLERSAGQETDTGPEE